MATTILRFFIVSAMLLLVAACDDDSKKEKPEHEVEIYFSDGVKIYLREMKAEREFKKPRVHVDHPDNVKVTNEERTPRKKIVFDFSHIALSGMLLLLALAFSCLAQQQGIFRKGILLSFPIPTMNKPPIL